MQVYKELPFAQLPGVPENTQVASAMHTLAPLAARDHELLVLFSAVLREVAKASAPGCEEELVHICRWLVQLLLSRLASKPTAEEAVMSFLWCLIRNDSAFAAAIQCKKHRLDKRQLPGGCVQAVCGWAIWPKRESLFCLVCVEATVICRTCGLSAVLTQRHFCVHSSCFKAELAESKRREKASCPLAWI